MTLSEAALLAALPTRYPVDLLPDIAARVAEAGRKLIVLDDDPTGTQTVYEVPVLTRWEVDRLSAELRDPSPLLYILTNSRSLPVDQAVALIESIMVNIRAALRTAPRPVDVISRSDSTLRGHFPQEIDAIRRGLSDPVDGILVIPAFFEGGRLTLNDVHYVVDNGVLTPVAETDYARDAAFGYTHSSLREWIAEKHSARPAPPITSIDLITLRRSGPAAVARQLQEINGGTYVIVNAADYRDLEVFVAGLIMAEAAGKHFIARCAASYVRIRAGLAPRALLDSVALHRDEAEARMPGLIIAGSYIAKSSAQIARALTLPTVRGVEVPVDALLDTAQRQGEIERAITAAANQHQAGYDVLIYTSRALLSGSDGIGSLQIGQRISAALVEIVQRLPFRPGWIIAKGGITSSDIATAALSITRAWVLGQILPGVPVWRADPGSLWPGMTYVVFPGNVGNESALAHVIGIMRGE